MEKKKKIIQINTVCNNSTGRIMHDIQVAASNAGYDTLSIVGRRKVYTDVPCVKYGNFVSFWMHVAITTVFDKQGWGSFFETKKIVNRLRKEQPDIIHLHNIHGYYLNLPLFFQYLTKEFKGKVFWTMHDCWSITGHCAYYVLAQCDRWKKECHDCPNKKEYPISLFLDSSKKNYQWKKRVLDEINNLMIFVPSQWLYTQIKYSFLKDNNVFVIANGIDLNIFAPRTDRSILEKYKIPNKKILLGVASVWEKRKGLEDFIQIAEAIDERYIIILVGLTQKQCKKLPANMIGISRTEDSSELAELYSAADIFINPSREETFSLVTVEAMACGTPVIVVAGSATEELVDEYCGIVQQTNELSEYIKSINRIMDMQTDKEKIVAHARKYSKEAMVSNVIKKYEDNVM